MWMNTFDIDDAMDRFKVTKTEGPGLRIDFIGWLAERYCAEPGNVVRDCMATGLFDSFFDALEKRGY